MQKTTFEEAGRKVIFTDSFNNPPPPKSYYERCVSILFIAQQGLTTFHTLSAFDTVLEIHFAKVLFSFKL
jgi:hypothetical protein